MAKYYIHYNRVYVYMLFDNILNAPIYIGATNDLKKRDKGHRHNLLCNYINKNNVIMEVLEETNEHCAILLEKYWYWQMKSFGFSLLNSNRLVSYQTPYYMTVTKVYNKDGYLYYDSIYTMAWRWFIKKDIDLDLKWKEFRTSGDGFKRVKISCSQLPKKRID